MAELKLTAVIWKEEDQYVSLCPQLDVSSFGGSKEDALINLKDAVSLYLEGEEFEIKEIEKEVSVKSFKVKVPKPSPM